MAKEWIVPDEDLGCDGAYFDYQELVRCRECKHRKDSIQCPLCSEGIKTADDWFCADGEREVQE